MATYIVEKFLEQEKTSFKVFTEPVAARILEAAFRAISETLRIGLTKKDSASVTVPWGKFTAERRVRNSGDSANTNISYEPTKAFLEALNSDGKDSGSYYQEDYDEQFSTAFVDYTAYGFFNPDADENKSKLATAKKCLRLDETDRDYFLNRIAALLVSIGKEKQRNGKSYRLEVDGEFAHGVYDFDYDNDEISVRFTADRAFKQYVKNDDVTGGNV